MNLGFVLLDLGEARVALEHFEQAIDDETLRADALAGKSAALHALGLHDDASISYRSAVALSSDFLDEAKLRSAYLWSENAIALVRTEIAVACPPTPAAPP